MYKKVLNNNIKNIKKNVGEGGTLLNLKHPQCIF